MYAGPMGRSRPDRDRRVPAGPPRPLQHDLVVDLARCHGYVKHARDRADDAGMGQSVLAELNAIAEQLGELHRVAQVAGGWCSTCSGELTDPGRSPSQARHYRACRVGWTPGEDEGWLRAVARPWSPGGAASG